MLLNFGILWLTLIEWECVIILIELKYKELIIRIRTCSISVIEIWIYRWSCTSELSDSSYQFISYWWDYLLVIIWCISEFIVVVRYLYQLPVVSDTIVFVTISPVSYFRCHILVVSYSVVRYQLSVVSYQITSYYWHQQLLEISVTITE